MRGFLLVWQSSGLISASNHRDVAECWYESGVMVGFEDRWRWVELET